ncbi:MAG: four helix bundle protein [bacterium]|nr:four helix bundle protein [bacterium]
MASYRELVVWQKAHQNFLDIIRALDGLPNSRVAWEIERQLVRSAGSIGANIAEGHGRQRCGRRTADARNFYEIAYGSSAETDNWLQVVADLRWIDSSRVVGLQQKNEEVMRMLYALIERSGIPTNNTHASRLTPHA